MPHFQVTMPGHDRDKSLGWLGVAWIEHFYRHGEGDIRGAVMCMDDDFAAFTVDAYALDTVTGRRLYDLVVLSRPKGTAKSELAGGIALFEAHGPCRFAGWAEGGETFTQYDFTYTYLPGEPMGTFITDPIIRIMATEETQVGNTFENVRANLEDEGMPLRDNLEGRQGFFSGAGGVKLPRGGVIKLSTAGSKSKDGGKETLAIADETHLYTGGLRDMYNTVNRNLRKRKAAQPWMFATTTMYRAGENSVAEGQHKLALAIKEGKAKTNPRMLFDHREGHAITDLEDEKELRAALLEAYAGRTWVDYDAMVNATNDPNEDIADFRRYNLNQQASGSSAYVTSQELQAVNGTDENPIPPLKKGDTITLGMDYAPGNRGPSGSKKPRHFRIPDATALVACRLSDMSLHPLGIWEADEILAKKDGWNPPMPLIEQTVRDAFKTYRVVGMFADPTGMESYLDKWTAEFHKHLKVRASTNRPMYRYMSGRSAAQSGRDVDALYLAIATEQVKILPDMTLTRHFMNARRAKGDFGTTLFKPNGDSPQKIDAAVTCVLAYAAAVQALNQGLGGNNRTRRIAGRIY